MYKIEQLCSFDNIIVNGKRVDLMEFCIVWRDSDSIKSIAFALGLTFSEVNKLARILRKNGIKLPQIKNYFNPRQKSQGDKDMSSAKSLLEYRTKVKVPIVKGKKRTLFN